MLERREMTMYEVDGHRSLADCRGHAFDGGMPDVAGGEDSGDVRLEQERRPLQRPLLQVNLRNEIRARQNEAICITSHRVLQPLGSGRGTDEHKDVAGSDLLFFSRFPIANPQALEVLMPAAPLDFGVESHLDV